MESKKTRKWGFGGNRVSEALFRNPHFRSTFSKASHSYFAGLQRPQEAGIVHHIGSSELQLRWNSHELGLFLDLPQLSALDYDHHVDHWLVPLRMLERNKRMRERN